MGMFTSVLHPDDNRELQIKTGHDSCDTYRVGDTVQWYVSSQAGLGTLLDGVYPSHSGEWVVIKDHVVFAVEPAEMEYEDVYEQYGVQETPRDLWSEEAWLEDAAREARAAEEYAEFLKECEGMSPREVMAASIGRSIRRRLDYSSIARQVFSLEPLDDKEG